MANAPLLSILMPTKNRSECAQQAILSILRFEDRDFELIIHDNSDDDALADWIAEQPDDSRRRYFRTRGELSISENFELAIDQARGDYVGALGDDDGVDESVLKLCRWLRDNDIDAMTPKKPASYHWPGLQRGESSSPAPGRLTIHRFSGRLTLADPEHGLELCVRRGATRLENLPCLYHGVVRRRCLEKVHEQSGRWLPGVSPDMAAAVALASHVNRIALLDYPVFVPGASPRSGAGRGVTKTHQGELKQERFLDAGFVASWPAGIPAYFTGPTMWGAAAVQALEATGRHELLQRFNYAAVHAACLVFVPGYRRLMLQSLREASWTRSTAARWAAWARCTGHILLNCGRRAVAFARNRFVRQTTFVGPEVPNIAEAMLVVRGQVSPLALPTSPRVRRTRPTPTARPKQLASSTGSL